MKSFLKFNLYLLLVIVSLHAQNISMEDFRIPESRSHYLFGGFQGNYGNHKFGNYFAEDASEGAMLRLSTNNRFEFNNEHESYYLQTEIEGEFGMSSVSVNNKNNASLNLSKTTSSNERSNINLSGQYSFYLSPDKVYVYSQSSLSGSYGLSRSDVDTNNVRKVSDFSKSRTIDGTISGGIGYGKMRNASAVFSIVRILEKFQEDGILNRELTKEEILSLVDIYAKREEYYASYERATKYLLDDLFQKLETMGVLKDNKVTAYEVARTEEVFQEFIFSRMVGWTIAAGLEVGRSQFENTSGTSYYPWYFGRSDQNNLVMSASYGHPFSIYLHWYSSVNFALPILGKQNRVNQYMNSALYYQIGERISNEFVLTYLKYNRFDTGTPNFEQYRFSNSLIISNTARYFVENNIYFSFTIGYSDWTDRSEPSIYFNRTTNSGTEISFGLNYRFF